MFADGRVLGSPLWINPENVDSCYYGRCWKYKYDIVPAYHKHVGKKVEIMNKLYYTVKITQIGVYAQCYGNSAGTTNVTWRNLGKLHQEGKVELDAEQRFGLTRRGGRGARWARSRAAPAP